MKLEYNKAHNRHGIQRIYHLLHYSAFKHENVTVFITKAGHGFTWSLLKMLKDTSYFPYTFSCIKFGLFAILDIFCRLMNL